MKCIIVDDEALAREGMERLVNEVGFLELAGVYGNALAAKNALQNNAIDLMFLDINMPKISGLEFLETLVNPPMTILTTAYSQYALEGFRLNILDYLVKPISDAKFLKAAGKAWDYYQLKEGAINHSESGTDHIFVKQNQVYEKIMFSSILYLQAMQNYVIIKTVDHQYTCHITFKLVEQSFPPENFMRVHKSYIINTKHVKSINGNVLYIHDFPVPISRGYKELVMKKIVLGNLLSR